MKFFHPNFSSRTFLRTAAVFGALALVPAVVSGAEPAKEPRAARSVHLGYPAPEAVLFYNEVVVEESVPGSYFMACGWSTGYFGIQELGASGEKVVIFSVWDTARGDNPNAVPAEQRVEVLHQGEDVKISRFGGEGTGGKSLWNHSWKFGETNKFLVTAHVEGEKTAYTAYFFLNESHQWKKLASFRTFTGGAGLKGFYSFVEDFRRDGRSAGQVRRARFGNGWVKTTNGDWVSLARARFTASNSEREAKNTIDAGLSHNDFFLTTGGATQNHTPLRATLVRPLVGLSLPELDSSLPKNP